MTAVPSSTRGYWTEIGSPHPRQRPRRTSQETTGTLSYHERPRPHLGQRDGGCTTDCLGSAPHRRMQTLRKLPRHAPSSAAYAVSTRLRRTGGSSIGTRDLVEQDAGGDRHVERLDAPSERDGHPAAGR